MTNADTHSQFWSRTTAVTFLALLWLPLLTAVLQPDSERSLSEQRSLAGFPALSQLDDLAELPTAVSNYYDDQIGLRNDMIRAWAWLHIELLGVTPSDSLIVGRDGWFFFGDERAIAQVRGLSGLTDAQLDRWVRELETRQQWLRDRGIAYLLVLVPNKHRVYAEYLPPSVPRMGGTSTLDQLAARLAADRDIEVLDVRHVLQQAGRTRRTYHKTDTHWNDYGAYAAYTAILRRTSGLLPAFAPMRPVAVKRLDRTTPGLGLSRIVGLSRAYPELSYDLVVQDPRAAIPPARRAAHHQRAERRLPFAMGTGDTSQPTAVVFRDSFANALVPYLSENFSRVVYVWAGDIDPNAIDSEKPDIVIHEIAERFLAAGPRGFEVVLRNSGQAPR
jgi:alginate O-acetyltransferase complex protein AlgJ